MERGRIGLSQESINNNHVNSGERLRPLSTQIGLLPEFIALIDYWLLIKRVERGQIEHDFWREAVASLHSSPGNSLSPEFIALIDYWLLIREHNFWREADLTSFHSSRQNSCDLSKSITNNQGLFPLKINKFLARGKLASYQISCDLIALIDY